MSTTRKGTCLCGKVQLEADISEPHFHACHCAFCRKWGGPALACPADAVRVDDASPLSHYRSSDYGERGFCAECGTHLYWRMQDGSHYAVWIGVLEASNEFDFRTQIFIDSKPQNYAFANNTPTLTGEQVFALYQSSSD